MLTGKLAMFVFGTLFGSAGFKLLASKDARKVYTHAAAAAIGCCGQGTGTISYMRSAA